MKNTNKKIILSMLLAFGMPDRCLAALSNIRTNLASNISRSIDEYNIVDPNLNRYRNWIHSCIDRFNQDKDSVSDESKKLIEELKPLYFKFKKNLTDFKRILRQFSEDLTEENKDIFIEVLNKINTSTDLIDTIINYSFYSPYEENILEFFKLQIFKKYDSFRYSPYEENNRSLKNQLYHKLSDISKFIDESRDIVSDLINSKLDLDSKLQDCDSVLEWNILDPMIDYILQNYEKLKDTSWFKSNPESFKSFKSASKKDCINYLYHLTYDEIQNLPDDIRDRIKKLYKLYIDI